jgi:Na+/melibiose symporter-like transporter
MLTIIKYQEPIEVDGILVEQAQSVATRDGMFLMVTLIPAAGMFLTCIPILFFDYTGKKKEQIRLELEVMRQERMSKAQASEESVQAVVTEEKLQEVVAE